MNITARAENFPWQPGIFKQEIKLEDGFVLRFGLFIPQKFTNSKAVPLVVALHYGGEVFPYYGFNYMKLLVEPALGQLGAIIVAPDCPDKSWQTSKSETAILKLLAHLKTLYPIDEKKIAITGFSMGGKGTWHMIARYPTLFSAAIPMAGKADPEDLGMISRTPVYIIHSDADEFFPLADARETFNILKKKGTPVKLKIVRGIPHLATSEFVGALKTASPWLKKIWQD